MLQGLIAIEMNRIESKFSFSIHTYRLKQARLSQYGNTAAWQRGSVAEWRNVNRLILFISNQSNLPAVTSNKITATSKMFYALFPRKVKIANKQFPGFIFPRKTCGGGRRAFYNPTRRLPSKIHREQPLRATWPRTFSEESNEFFF